MKFKTLEDAKNWFESSGYYDWQWYNGFNEDDFVEYAYRNCEDFEKQDDLVKAYLLREGVDTHLYFK